MRSDKYKSVSDRDLAEQYFAVDDGDFARADEIVQSVKEEFGESSPVYDEMNRFLRVNRWVEEL